jgi:hypothetical protein
MDLYHYVYVYCNAKLQYTIENPYGLKYIPIYVGKGVGSRDRSHLKGTRNIVFKKYLEKMKQDNNEPKIIRIKENISQGEAYNLESKIINFLNVIYDNKGPLFNQYVNAKMIYSINDETYINNLIEKYDEITKLKF